MRFFTLLSIAVPALAAYRTSPKGALRVGSGYNYSTIQAAVDALDTSTTSDQAIFIYPGTYTEQVYIPELSGQLYVYGYTNDTSSYKSNQVTIAYNASIAAGAADDDATGTVRNWSNNTAFYNINIKNTSGKEGAQALALSAWGGYQGYYGVGLYGYQDTLLSEIGYQVYVNSYIEGATDFVFGQYAVTWFENIDIGIVGAGYITADGRDSESNPSYYVFNNANVGVAAGYTVANGTSYLGRPWRTYARVCFQNSYLGAVINSAGWSIWSTSAPQTDNVTYEEYNNTGPGAQGTRASFSTELSSALTIESILGSDYTDWVDPNYL